MRALGPAERHAHRRLLARETLASALYLSLVLLSSLVAVPRESLPDDTALVGIIFGVTIGLVAAHWFAFRLAAHITAEDGNWTPTAAQEAVAQLIGGLMVAALAALPFLLLDGRGAWRTALIVLAAVPTLVGMGIARMRERSWYFTILYGLGSLAIAMGVVVLKTSLTH